MYNRRNYGRRRAARPAPEPVKAFIGPQRLPTREATERLVHGMIESHKDGGAFRHEVVEWILATGDCVLHAVHEIRVRRGWHSVCYCTTCNPTADIRGFGGAIILTR